MNKNSNWNEKCEEILKKYAKGVIDFEEYCELMKKEDVKIKANKDTKNR